MNAPGPLLTPERMAELFGVEVSTIMGWNRKYGWPHVRVGYQVRWTEEQLDEILRRHSQPAAEGGARDGLPGQTVRSVQRSRSTPRPR